MRLDIAGGCGDFGRSCFFVSGSQHAYIVDCGTSTDGLDRVPDLTAEEIRGAEYLFLTHSHRDHTGAVEFAESAGFAGPVIMSAQTYRQLHYKPKNAVIMDSTAPEAELLPGFSFRWGRTGHCCGAVWYAITCEGKTAFFSGDYREGDPFYRNDPVRGLSADIAVIDAAYPSEEDGAAMRERFLAKAEELLADGAPLILPVPRFGRGLSMAVALRERTGDRSFFMSERLWREWSLFARRKYFVTPSVLSVPADAFSLWDGETVAAGGVYFLTDAQLSHPESRRLLEAHPEARVLISGSAHGYGRAQEFLDAGRAEQVLWPNHMTYGEMRRLAAMNDFRTVIPFHDPRRKPEARSFEF